MADPRKFPTMINDVNSLVVNTLSTTSPAIANFIGAMLPLAELALGIFVAFSLMGWLINTLEDVIDKLKERSTSVRSHYEEKTPKDWLSRKK